MRPRRKTDAAASSCLLAASQVSPRSSVFAEAAAERVRLLHQAFARNDLDDVVIVLLVLHVLFHLALGDDDWTDALMVFLAVVHVTDKGGEGFALLVGLDNVRRVETAGFLDHVGPMREADIGVFGTPFRLVA